MSTGKMSSPTSEKILQEFEKWYNDKNIDGIEYTVMARYEDENDREKTIMAVAWFAAMKQSLAFYKQQVYMERQRKIANDYYHREKKRNEQ